MAYTWRMQLPLLIIYTSANEERKAHFAVTMDIVRVSVIDAVKNIQINKFSVVIE
ncbi:DotI/IcmL/TraM family protein [Coxiella-like endosymbiont of Rhipicephalus sanguineus]|uniref:DotI/IcmL/TraM family protein n=1 Tax=Coxiella-like endosymbiont of Rhipicephalus sanguineus TaxID=1955402 RepID=UPI00255A7214|nr:DotI/IcmL/TraM family protein [Coxiella-like endosymbiont of Rhipicephalus sanguineus]